jgi:hypothetical protein
MFSELEKLERILGRKIKPIAITGIFGKIGKN